MLKVILVICFLIALAFVVQGFVEVATADDLFDVQDSVEVSDE